MLSVKQDRIKYHFLTPWYDSTWEWTLVSRAIGEYSTHKANELRGSTPGRVIPRTLKLYLLPPCLTLIIIRYASRVKWSNPGKGVARSSTSRCSSYWKGSLRVALDYNRQLYLLFVDNLHIKKWDIYIVMLPGLETNYLIIL